MAQGYSKNQLFQIGKDNYKTLVRYCDMLWQEGYWEKPESILNYSIFEMLDLYIQSVMVQLASACGCFHTDECSYIAKIPEQNMLGITSEAIAEEEFISQTQKILKTPPILLQLCSLRDVEHSSSIAGLFFDALLNILLAMSYLNNTKSITLTRYILGYYSQVSAFIKTGSNLTYTIDERYVFRKISNDELEYSNELLLASDGDFERYKNKYIYQNTKEKKKDLPPGKKKEAAQTSNKRIEENLAQPEPEQGVDRLNRLMEELNSLIGLDSVKTEINSLINMIKVKKLREEYNMPTMDMSYHMVYTGNPGTGKTTVARLVAKIYKELGILSDGNLVETDRSGLVAGYVGQTALKVREVAESAIGGILFIDEAYALSSNAGNNDFGSEAIDTLVKIMEDHRDNLVVIVAGYRDEMQQFLKSNTGLISRFNKFIDFPNYTVDELIKILNAMARKSGFTIQEKAFQAIRIKLLNLQESIDYGMDTGVIKEFGNARGIRNIFEKMVVNHANRVVTYNDPTKEQLSEILLEDTVNV